MVPLLGGPRRSQIHRQEVGGGARAGRERSVGAESQREEPGTSETSETVDRRLHTVNVSDAPDRARHHQVVNCKLCVRGHSKTRHWVCSNPDVENMKTEWKQVWPRSGGSRGLTLSVCNRTQGGRGAHSEAAGSPERDSRGEGRPSAGSLRGLGQSPGPLRASPAVTLSARLARGGPTTLIFVQGWNTASPAQPQGTCTGTQTHLGGLSGGSQHRASPNVPPTQRPFPRCNFSSGRVVVSDAEAWGGDDGGVRGSRPDAPWSQPHHPSRCLRNRRRTAGVPGRVCTGGSLGAH